MGSICCRQAKSTEVDNTSLKVVAHDTLLQELRFLNDRVEKIASRPPRVITAPHAMDVYKAIDDIPKVGRTTVDRLWEEGFITFDQLVGHYLHLNRDENDFRLFLHSLNIQGVQQKHIVEVMQLYFPERSKT